MLFTKIWKVCFVLVSQAGQWIHAFSTASAFSLRQRSRAGCCPNLVRSALITCPFLAEKQQSALSGTDVEEEVWGGMGLQGSSM